MEQQIIAIRDKALEAFMRPFFAPAIQAAVRSFQDEVQRPESEMAKHPGDYSLWHFGTFNDSNGAFALFETPKLIVEAAHVSK